MIKQIKTKIYVSYPVFYMTLYYLLGRKNKEIKYLISEKYNFIYIPIQKVANTSLLGVFLPLAMGRGISRPEIHNTSLLHISKSKLKKYTDSGLFAFSFVRNPYDRIVSCYEHKISKESVTNNNFTNGVANILTIYKGFYAGMPFEEFASIICQIPDYRADVHFRSQHKFLCNRLGEPLVNFVGRYENLENDFRKVCIKIGIYHQLPHYQKSPKKYIKYHSYYSKETKEIVRKRYKKDFEIFNYEF